jgi:hypothetical protein
MLASACAVLAYSRSMRRVLRRRLIGLLSVGLAVLLGMAAIVDHHVKRTRINRAEVAEWYCAHQGVRCGGPSSEAIERHWNERELGYVFAVTVLGVFGVGHVVLDIRR